MKVSTLAFHAGLALALAGCAGDSRTAARVEARYATAYLDQLKAEGAPTTVVTMEDKPHQLDIWKGYFAPSFPNGFRYDRGIRLLLNDVQRGGKVAVFIFAAPKEKDPLLRTSEQMQFSGTLVSKAQTYYVAAANQEVIALFLTEQERLPADSKLVESWRTTLRTRH